MEKKDWLMTSELDPAGRSQLLLLLPATLSLCVVSLQNDEKPELRLEKPKLSPCFSTNDTDLLRPILY